ncbi:C40 family peptidase [Actinoplanes sp. TBRC 11911]|uniref:C40 family peptidase n=1 Tax=Actinoplanes sp. TBRC 11911 TaxID=2729386 RepID=UPI00145E1B91|nr:C40 family peptidase [Actinoplanes sp. TBRC 11911]NMO54347.1 C40 family peptidase [Actinoplanes sp. TBRC 11911]
MATARFAARQSRSARPWWRPVVLTAAAAAIAALFTPMPAFAGAPVAPRLAPAPPVPAVQSVPDTGSRPIVAGTFVMPGQQSPTPGTPTPTPTTTTSSSPVVQKAEKGRAEIATLGDQLIALGQERDLAKTQSEAAQAKHAKTQETLRQAQSAASDAAAAAIREAAAMPPGSFDPGLMGLDDLARIQRGDDSGQGAAAQQLANAQLDEQVALDEASLAEKKYDDLVTQYDKLNADIGKKEAAQQAYEKAHAPELNAAQAVENATDNSLANKYLSGSEAGRSADPRAAQALQYALRQIGKPYEWSEEGPGSFDCSGLMWAAYRSVGVYDLPRVSRDQYWATRDKVVDRYSLLPGDLIFFSYSNSWEGIHHVAMYAGNGMMVEAPRTGLDVRLTKVRWSQMFQATRVLGSVEGVTQGPDLSHITPDDSNTAGGGSTTSPSTRPPTSPSSKPPTSPTSKPPTTPTSKPPTSPSSRPPTTPTSKPPTSDPTTKPPTSDPTTKPPATEDPTTTPTPDPTTESPSDGGSSSGGSDPSSSSAEATEHATSSAASEDKESSATPSGSK